TPVEASEWLAGGLPSSAPKSRWVSSAVPFGSAVPSSSVTVYEYVALWPADIGHTPHESSLPSSTAPALADFNVTPDGIVTRTWPLLNVPVLRLPNDTWNVLSSAGAAGSG